MTAYEITTADGITYMVEATDDKAAHRVARAHLRDNLTHINPMQAITVTPLDGHGIAWHRD
jgi:hypothetical protein